MLVLEIIWAISIVWFIVSLTGTIHDHFDLDSGWFIQAGVSFIVIILASTLAEALA